ncbi:MAG TPA: hypothetical protein VFO77_13915, partial [Actinoplanes sp.]|nr:hypothetical protein [Actinoplanes sp.]
MRKKIAAAVVVGAFVSAVLPGAPPASAAAAAAAGAGVRADFNGDGVSDLAIGVPDEDSAVPDSGAVNVIYGSAANGLRAAGNQLWTQDSPGIRDTAEAYDGFGHAVAAGDFNGDGYSDLAVGVPFEIIGANRELGEGAVNVIYGSAAGLTAAGNQFWSQDSPGVGDVAEADDQFGFSLAVGNLGGSAHDDLAIGVPAEDPHNGGPTLYDTGAVNVIYGTATGLKGSAQNPVWTQDSPGIAETAELHDQFGLVLAIGNFGRSNYDDLAVGVPEEATGPEGVHVIYGAASGLSSSGSQYWSQNSAGIADAAEDGDRFGRSLAAGDLGRSAYDDLAIGAPSETLAATLQGAVHVIYGTPTGLAAAGSQFWSQDSPGIAVAGEYTDQFGWALTIGDFGRSAHEDLAVGVPNET